MKFARYFLWITCLLLLQHDPAAQSTTNPPFSERVRHYSPQAFDLFYIPHSAREKRDLQLGRQRLRKTYGGGTFRGYVLFADPYDVRTQHISFLLGTDCSHFVHRLFQLLGADYPYAKTWHFLQYARNGADHLPADASENVWREFTQKFEVLTFNEASLQPGDLLVYGGKMGPQGERGHVGMVLQVEPLRILNAKNQVRGIVSESLPYFVKPHLEIFVFRWRDKLRELSADSIKTLLQQKVVASPNACNTLLKANP